MNTDTKDYLKMMFENQGRRILDDEERRIFLKDYEREIVSFIEADENKENIEMIEKLHKSLDRIVEQIDFTDEILKIVLKRLNIGESKKEEVKKNSSEAIAAILNQIVMIFKMRELEALYEREKSKKSRIREYKRILKENLQLRELVEKIDVENELKTDNSLNVSVHVIDANVAEIVESSRKFFNVRNIGSDKIKISLSPCGKSALKYYRLSQSKRYTEEELEEQIFSNCLCVVEAITQENNNNLCKIKMNRKHELALKFAVSKAKTKMYYHKIVVDSYVNIDNEYYADNFKKNYLINRNCEKGFVTENDAEVIGHESNRITEVRRNGKDILEKF